MSTDLDMNYSLLASLNASGTVVPRATAHPHISTRPLRSQYMLRWLHHISAQPPLPDIWPVIYKHPWVLARDNTVHTIDLFSRSESCQKSFVFFNSSKHTGWRCSGGGGGGRSYEYCY